MQNTSQEGSQEKQIEFMSHTYNRLGSLTVLSIKKESDNNSSKKQVDEYFIVRKVNSFASEMEVEGLSSEVS